MSAHLNFPFFITMVIKIPVILTALIGVVLSAAGWRQRRRAALLAGLGCGLMVLINVISAGMGVVPLVAVQQGVSLTQAAVIVSVVGGVLSLMEAAALGLLLAALFSRKNGTGEGH